MRANAISFISGAGGRGMKFQVTAARPYIVEIPVRRDHVMRPIRWRAVLALVVGALSMAARAADCGVTLRVAAHGVWHEPQTSRFENQQDQVILQQVAEDLHWCLDWEKRETNITRRLAMIRDGEVDMLIGASRTPDRAVYSWFSEPYRNEAVQLFVRVDERDKYNGIRSFDQLLSGNANLIALRDSFLGVDYARHRDELLAMHRVSEVDSYALGRSMLLAGRGDVLVAPDTFGDFLRVEHDPSVASLDWQPYRAPVYFMFSRKTVSPDQVKRFDAALDVVLHLPAHRL